MGGWTTGRARRAALAALVGLTVLAGCGGDDGDDAATEDTESAADDTTTTTAAADDSAAVEPAGGDFCTQVKAVLELSKEVGLGPGSIPGADELQQILDAQKAIDPPAEIEADWDENLGYSEEGIAIAREAEANGKTAYEDPYLDQSLAIAMKQGPGAGRIDDFVKATCGFSVQLGTS